MTRISCLPVFLAGLLLAGELSGAAEIPLEVYGRPDTVATMAVSPNGDRIAFRRRDQNMDAVFIVDIESGDILGVVDGSETNLRRVSFLDQDRLVLLAEDAQHINFRLSSMKLKVSSSFVFDVRTNELTKLLENSRRLYPLQSGVGRIVGHNPETDALYMPAFLGELNGPPAGHGLLEVTLEEPGGRVLERGGANTTDWFVDIEGNVLAEEEYDVGKNRHRIWGRNGKKRVLLHESNDEERHYNVTGLSGDFQSLVVSAVGDGSDNWSYFEMDLSDGSVGPPLFHRDNVSVERPLVDSHRRVHGVEYSGFFPTYEFLDPARTERVQAIQAGLKNTASYLVDWTPDFRFLLFRITGGWTSGAYVIVGPDSTRPKMLAAVRDQVPREAVAPTAVIQYTSRDGLEIPALVTVRDDVRSAGKAPLIVLPHGGPAAHDRFEFDWMAQYFANRGIAVLQPQFRGSDGFGATLLSAGEGAWATAMSKDLDDGVQQLIEDGLVDPARVCMVGSSYGGYAALAAGAFSPFDYKCLVSISGLADLTRWMVTTRDKYGEDSNAVDYWAQQFGDHGRSGGLEDISPVNFAKNFRGPVLLIHGRDDAVVPLDQSLRMEKALKRAKKQVELVRLKGEDHYLSGYETRLEALTAVAAFIDKNL